MYDCYCLVTSANEWVILTSINGGRSEDLRYIEREMYAAILL